LEDKEMKRFTILSIFSAFLLVLFFVGNSPTLFGVGGTITAPTMYKVTITNLTRGQPFSPVIIATHSEAMTPLFELGQPASAELFPVAEDADFTAMTTLLMNDSEVWDYQTLFGVNGPILPGETASVIVESETGYPLVSMVSMLVVTNDAFFGLNGAELPFLDPMRFTPPAFDAGSHTNNQHGRFIPGPPFGSGGVRDTSMAEGYIHVHSGVFGGSFLEPATYDWKNPVAYIIVEPQ
jgi:hypothetical protein